jgi:predicted nucleic acid-binding protein
MIRFPLPNDIYLDTSVVVAATYPGTANSDSASELCNDIRNAGVKVYFSEVLRLEFGRAIRRLATISDRLPPHARDRYELDKWSSRSLIRQRWLSNGVRRLSDLLLTFPTVVEIPLSNELWLESIGIMGMESLDATDALHLATAKAAGVNDFFTVDSDFRRVASPRIHLVRDI